PNELAVVDLDVKGGHDGIAAWSTISANIDHGPGVEIVTPSGGRHLIWRDSEGIPTTAGKFAPGIDTRGVGGYIVGAGSRLPGGAYSGTLPKRDDVPLASEALAAFLRSPQAATRTTGTGTSAPLSNSTPR